MRYDDFSWYRGNLTWLPQNTIFLTKHGSQAYGTALPTSDTDLKGVAIPPKQYFLGFTDVFEQAMVQEPVDAVVYDVRKFFKLAADCNPNIIEVLYTDPADHVLTRSWWRTVAENRDAFLSQKAKHTFSGYAVAQLNRIKSHRAWLLNPPKAEPRRADFGLKEGTGTIGKEQLGVINAEIRKHEDALAGTGLTRDQVAEHEEALVETGVTDLNLSPDLIPLVIAERRYAAACRHWSQYQKWKVERNEGRAALEAQYGYDTKHAMHLVRLLLMADEILSGRGVIVKRPNADSLLAIRRGVWTYDELVDWATRTEASLATIDSPLPKQPNRHHLNTILVDLVDRFLAEGT